MAYFMCKRSYAEPTKKRARKFTVEEIEPFVTVEYRDSVTCNGVLVAALGVAIQKTDGVWGLHELRDETVAKDPGQMRATVETADLLKDSAAMEIKKRVLHSLNRLREHHEKLYIYAVEA